MSNTNYVKTVKDICSDEKSDYHERRNERSYSRTAEQIIFIDLPEDVLSDRYLTNGEDKYSSPFKIVREAITEDLNKMLWHALFDLREEYDEKHQRLHESGDEDERRKWSIMDDVQLSSFRQKKVVDGEMEYFNEYYIKLWFDFRAPYPSKVPSATEIVELLASLLTKESLVETINNIIDEGVEKAREAVAANDLIEDADRVASHIADVARKKAMEVTRFKQRLAALEAELKAEIDAQVEQQFGNADIDELAEDWEIAPRAIKTGIAKYGKKVSPGTNSSPFPTTGSMNKITQADLVE